MRPTCSAAAVTALEGGTVAVQDAAVQAVVAILPPFMELNQLFVEVGPQEEELAADLGRARYEIYGTDVPPDATFSLRIADGVATGYEYNGTVAPVFTTFYGLYDRHFSHAGKDDWALPQRLADAADELDLGTPVNFVSTVDIIGGNSGSPVLDRDRERRRTEAPETARARRSRSTIASPRHACASSASSTSSGASTGRRRRPRKRNCATPWPS